MTMESGDQRAATIDFKKYRTPELAVSVTEIVDVRGKLASGFKTAFFSFTGFLLLVGVAFWWRGNLATFSLAIGYSLFAGAVFSLVMAIAGAVKRSLAEMEQLVGLLFSTTSQIASDIASLGTGSTTLPSARKLIEGVYGDVLLPTVEQVVAKSLGWIGTPVLFAYKLTLGRVVRFAIKCVPDTAFAADEDQLNERAQQVMAELESISDEKENTDKALNWAQRQLEYIGTKARFLVMLPCYIISVAIVVIVLIPLAILYCWG